MVSPSSPSIPYPSLVACQAPKGQFFSRPLRQQGAFFMEKYPVEKELVACY